MHKIEVSLVYALPSQQYSKRMIVPKGTSAIELVRLTGVLKEIEELHNRDEGELILGVYSSPVNHDYLLEDSDRVEIYRPLTADPKEVRRQLALVGKTIGNKK